VHNAVIIIGFSNLVISVVEFLRPDLWEGLWKSWAQHRLFRLHGIVLLVVAGLLAAALPVPRLQLFLWITIVLLTLIGGTITFTPDTLARPIAELYLNQSEEELHRLTYIDGAFRVMVGLCLIFSVVS